MPSSLQRQNFLSWAYNHNLINHPKYSTSPHAIYVTFTGTIIFLLTTFLTREFIFSQNPQCEQMQQSSEWFGYFLIVYLMFMMSSRYLENGSVVIYEFLWACNQALLLGAISMITRDSNLLRATIVLVSFDQLLWYVDLLGFFIKRKFYVGVAKYVIWPETTKLRLMTTFHHVWYIPLVLWLTAPSVSSCGLNLEVFALCCAMSLALAVIGRLSAPKQVIIPKIKHHSKKDQDQTPENRTVYLNLNLSWELWKDVKSGLLTKCYQKLPQKLIPIFLSLFWDMGCFIGFLILVCIESLYN